MNNNNEKKLIINYLIKERLYLILSLLVLLAIVLFVNIDSQIKLFASIFLGIGLGIVLLILIFRILFVVFSKNIQLADGYICDRKENRFSDSTYMIYARAKTNDGSKTTGKQQIFGDYISGQVPVKILIYNDIARRFFITKESREYVIKQREKAGKKNNYIIVKIILTILVLLFLIMLFKSTFAN